MTGLSTVLSHHGRPDGTEISLVNPPICRGSTVLFPDLETMVAGRQEFIYGRHGNPTTKALAGLLRELDGPNAAATLLTPSGLSAITTALLSVVGSGDHVLISDSVYGPTRDFCTGVLARMGVETSFYPPEIGAGIAALMRPNTRAVFVESPGSQTFEMQDIPAIAAVAHAHGAKVLADNTWATPVNFRPLDFGVDLAIQSATKYIIGHSDGLMGVISANAESADALRATYRGLGLCVSADDASLALRGLRTLEVRLRRHQDTALTVARWLQDQPGVRRVLYPALPDAAGHAIWLRDFRGAAGLFGVLLDDAPFAAAAAMLNGLRLFGLGYSFGGYESLATFVDPRSSRTASPWAETGTLLRLQIGLEDPDDLIADLAEGLTRYRTAQDRAA